MNPTDELREGLDELGVKYNAANYNNCVFWGDAEYEQYSDGHTRLIVDDATPEQAIAATVGGDEPPYNELVEALRRDWDIDVSWDGLRKFWNIALTEEGMRKRDAATVGANNDEHSRTPAELSKRLREVHGLHAFAELFGFDWTDESDWTWHDVACVMADAVDAATAWPKITEDTSDGWHTFKELYHHRALLFSVIVHNYRDMCWKSKRHDDGTELGWNFIVGIDTPWGQASYHYGMDYWDMFDCKVLERAPKYDGYTPEQSVERIAKLVELDAAKVVGE